MLHHLSFSVGDLTRSASFYDAVLGSLGYRRVFSSDEAAGWGHVDGEDQFAVKKRVSDVRAPSPGFHLAFAAKTRAEVDAFHAAALRAGGKNNGEPGLRPHYGPNYYACFVVDPDGYEIEAVIN